MNYFKNLTREDVVKFFLRNKRNKIVIEKKEYFWDSWKTTSFPQEPLINNILSCILFANDKLQYNKDGHASEEHLDEIKNFLQDRNLQQTNWSKKKLFESINISNINNDFFLFLCQEFYINLIICSEIGIKFYYLDDEFDKCIPTVILKSITDDITKQLYYQTIYKDKKILTMEDLSDFINYPDKFIIGLEKNKKFTLKNYSLIEQDTDIIHMDKRREMDKANSEEEVDYYDELEEIIH
jgi:hypothetical protein